MCRSLGFLLSFFVRFVHPGSAYRRCSLGLNRSRKYVEDPWSREILGMDGRSVVIWGDDEDVLES